MVTSYQDVLNSLNELDFPADKDRIVAEAQRAGADPGVLRALRALPPVEYANRAQVARSAAIDPAPEQDPAERAARARFRDHQRVAQHLRQP
ncbi:DUF2795 domain-containing protein [Solwaraspora sp. WMMD406]|uniref:DUF2795 domain-containing protein n=1 Tax=Solwaraspora sp. WMMD406 TaxID=3016095 RepID=UPI002417C95D|nr:DUF2795 domain-containing protein [Solwaraspora sp. WMMD406]MDG4762852.1 DUF2795 domain-containing protein [Solwaraspora sp. WMMD406]